MYGNPLGPNHVIVSKDKLFYRYWRRRYVYIYMYIYIYIHTYRLLLSCLFVCQIPNEPPRALSLWIPTSASAGPPTCQTLGTPAWVPRPAC